MRRSYSNFLGNSITLPHDNNIELTGSLSRKAVDHNSAKWNGLNLMYSLNEVRPQTRKSSSQVKLVVTEPEKPVNADYRPLTINQLALANRSRAEIGELGQRVTQEGRVKYSNATTSGNPMDSGLLSSHYPQKEFLDIEKRLRVSNDWARNSRTSQIPYLPTSKEVKEDPPKVRPVKSDYKSQILELPGTVKAEPKEERTPVKLKASRHLLTSTEKEKIYGPLAESCGPKREIRGVSEKNNPCMRRANRSSEMGVFQPSYDQDELGIQKKKRPEMTRCAFQSTLKFLC